MGEDRVVQSYALLPLRLRALLEQEISQRQVTVEELRLREGRPLSIVSSGEEWSSRALARELVSQRDLDWVLEAAGHGSIHTVLDQFRNGFLSVEGEPDRHLWQRGDEGGGDDQLPPCLLPCHPLLP